MAPTLSIASTSTPENTPWSTTFTLTDLDTVNTMAITFASTQQDKFSFVFNPTQQAGAYTGTLSLVNPANFEVDIFDDLTFLFSDGIHDASTTIALTITDLNDIAPHSCVFSDVHSHTIREDTPIGTVVALFAYTD